MDQFGGYTGMRPADFRAFVERIAHRIGFPGSSASSSAAITSARIGGGIGLPQTAMSHVDELVRSYVAAGYTKLHLDCSYPCADDNGPLSDEWSPPAPSGCSPSPKPRPPESACLGRLRYVIGTEVPTPGGAAHHIDECPADHRRERASHAGGASTAHSTGPDWSTSGLR